MSSRPLTTLIFCSMGSSPDPGGRRTATGSHGTRALGGLASRSALGENLGLPLFAATGTRKRRLAPGTLVVQLGG